MNEHIEQIELISRLIDGELSEDERQQTLAHIDECPECRRIYEAFLSLSETMGEDMVEPPAELYDSIMAGINSQKITPIHRRRARILTWAAGAAACVAVGFVALGVSGNLGGLGKSAATMEAAAAPKLAMTADNASADRAAGGEESFYAVSGSDIEAAEAPEAAYESGAADSNMPMSAMVAAGHSGLYYGLTSALITPAGAGEALIMDDWDTLLELTDLIIWGDEYAGDAPAGQPSYTLELYDEFGYMCTVSVWTDGDTILCSSNLDGYLYTAAGTPEQLEALIEG